MLPPSISAEAKPRSRPGLASALALAVDAKGPLPALTLAALSRPCAGLIGREDAHGAGSDRGLHALEVLCRRARGVVVAEEVAGMCDRAERSQRNGQEEELRRCVHGGRTVGQSLRR